MMNQDKRKTVMLYPAASRDLAIEIGMVCAVVLLQLVIGLDVLSDISGGLAGAVFGMAVALLFFSGAVLVGFLYWRMFTARDLLWLDKERGVLLQGRWRWGWQAQQEYPLSMFAAVAAEKVWDDYRGYYGRLWLESADGQNDLVLEENFLPYKDSLHRLDDIQSHIARSTGLAKRPVINTEFRAPEETAADLSKLHAPKPEILPAWRQAVNLAAAGLWTGWRFGCCVWRWIGTAAVCPSRCISAQDCWHSAYWRWRYRKCARCFVRGAAGKQGKRLGGSRLKSRRRLRRQGRRDMKRSRICLNVPR